MNKKATVLVVEKLGFILLSMLQYSIFKQSMSFYRSLQITMIIKTDTQSLSFINTVNAICFNGQINKHINYFLFTVNKG